MPALVFYHRATITVAPLLRALFFSRMFRTLPHCTVFATFFLSGDPPHALRTSAPWLAIPLPPSSFLAPRHTALIWPGPRCKEALGRCSAARVTCIRHGDVQVAEGACQHAQCALNGACVAG